MNKCRLLLAVLFVMCVAVADAQGTYDWDWYLRNARKMLKEGECEKAQRNYDHYQKATNDTDEELEQMINECLGQRVRTYTVDGVSFEMIAVKGGSFTMGCTDEQDDECSPDETPTHTVTLDDYYIGKFEVTQDLWYAVMGTTVSQQRDKLNTSWKTRGEGDNYPMYYVSWDEIHEFIRRLNKLTGATFRLPTEAEWEYAARGGNMSKGYKYSGSDDLEAVAWYQTNSKSVTHPVGQKAPNELGIYDMSGNVMEWCLDFYGSYDSNNQKNPKGPVTGQYRLLRGGDFYGIDKKCRVSFRFRSSHLEGKSQFGIRLATSK